jgi:hypothetical protein
MAHIYHWKHGWIPLTFEAALSKAKGNHSLAQKYLGAARSPEAGIHSRKHVAGAILDLPNVHDTEERHHASHQIKAAARKHGAEDLIPGTGAYKISNAEKMHGTGSKQHLEAQRLFGRKSPAGQSELPESKPSSLEGKDFRSMTGAEKIEAAARMHGTGSKQHQEAKRRFGRERAAVPSLSAKRDERAAQTPKQIHDRLQSNPRSVTDQELARLTQLGGRFAPAARDEQRRRDAAKGGNDLHDAEAARGIAAMRKLDARHQANRIPGFRAHGLNAEGKPQAKGGGYTEGQRVERLAPDFSKPGHPEVWQSGVIHKIEPDGHGHFNVTVLHDDGVMNVQTVGARGGNNLRKASEPTSARTDAATSGAYNRRALSFDPSTAPKARRQRATGTLGETVHHSGAASVNTGAADLPAGYKIRYSSSYGFSLHHNGKEIRTSGERDSLVSYAHDHSRGDTSAHPKTWAERIAEDRGTGGRHDVSDNLPRTSAGQGRAIARMGRQARSEGGIGPAWS